MAMKGQRRKDPSYFQYCSDSCHQSHLKVIRAGAAERVRKFVEKVK